MIVFGKRKGHSVDDLLYSRDSWYVCWAEDWMATFESIPIYKSDSNIHRCVRSVGRTDRMAGSYVDYVAATVLDIEVDLWFRARSVRCYSQLRFDRRGYGSGRWN